MIRPPAVAELFYPKDSVQLQHIIEGCIEPVLNKGTAVGVISPHAGYIYSGKVAGAVFSQIKVPKNVIILGPNHAGVGGFASVALDGAWDMPCGRVRINADLAEIILKQDSRFTEDAKVHAVEHSIELQVPFLQYFRPDVTIVPIIFTYSSYETCQSAGKALARAIRLYKKDVLIVASTDMTHYEPHDIATIKDSFAIDRILAMDGEGLLETVHRNEISMCGVIPVTIALETCKLLKACKASLVRYATSGEVSGDYDQVVGYGGFIIGLERFLS